MKLRAAREKAGLTQLQVAKSAGLPEQTYQKYEYDVHEPGVRTAIRIAETLGIETLDDFKGIFGAATPDTTDSTLPPES